MENVNDDM